MFVELENQVWTASDPAKVILSDNTDFAIDEKSKKIVFGLNAANEYVDMAFDEIDFSEYEELSLYIYCRNTLHTKNIFKITINDNEYHFGRLLKIGYNHVLIDCEKLQKVSSIRLTALKPALILFIDVIGVRKVAYNEMDVTILKALQNHIQLNYGFTTKLSKDMAAGESVLPLEDMRELFNNTMLELDNGTNSEWVIIMDNEGNLRDPVQYNYKMGDKAAVLCPVLLEDFDEMEPDPVCGVTITDNGTLREDVIIKCKNGTKKKRFIGNVGVTIYIDCTSKKKLMQLVREYQDHYGTKFIFLMDGELVEIYLEDEFFIDNEIGNNPRASFFYRIQPQPVTVATQAEITTFYMDEDSKEMEGIC